jgi:hypothetical protein
MARTASIVREGKEADRQPSRSTDKTCTLAVYSCSEKKRPKEELYPAFDCSNAAQRVQQRSLGLAGVILENMLLFVVAGDDVIHPVRDRA